MDVNKKSKYEEIRKFLQQLESISKPLSEHEISDKIKQFIKEKFSQNPPEILLWEQIAFDFTENYPSNRSGWGTYFGPRAVFQDKERKIVEYPSIHKVTTVTISYWEKRARESNHPVFKARYANIVWDFTEKINKERPHYSIAQIYADSVIEIAEKDLHKYNVDVIKKLERALSLVLSINDKDRINKLTDTIINYEEKIAEDDKPGLWGFSYELLIKNKKIQLDKRDEQKIINGLEDRFERLLKTYDHFATKRAAILLADYYSRSGNKEKVGSVLLELGKLIQKNAEKASALVGSAWLEELYHLYLQYGLKNEANKILSEIKELGKKSKSELKKIEASTKIPKDELQNYVDWLTDGDLRTVLKKIAVNYIPKKNEVAKQIQGLSKKAPISFLFTRKILDPEGRVIATVRSLEEDLEGHIALQISQNVKISSIFLRETLKKLVGKFNLTPTVIVDYFYESPIFDEKKKDFFAKGIEAFLKGDFLVALHILIPQVEALIRNLAEKIGVPILKSSRSGGFFYRTLDELLREEKIIKVLSEDMCLYLRVLFTDPRGWNLRNDVCHGISKIEDFNQCTADRIFHTLLCLALVKEKEKEENKK